MLLIVKYTKKNRPQKKQPKPNPISGFNYIYTFLECTIFDFECQNCSFPSKPSVPMRPWKFSLHCDAIVSGFFFFGNLQCWNETKKFLSSIQCGGLCSFIRMGIVHENYIKLQHELIIRKNVWKFDLNESYHTRIIFLYKWRLNDLKYELVDVNDQYQ